MLRRLHPDQPESFAFTPANLEWAQAQIAKYPEGRQASAVIPLLWRAQEQEGWLTRPAIEEVARMLDMASIRVLEVASFYFMYQLAPVGSVAHVQVCGTTSCMICGAEDLIQVCKQKIAPKPHQLSDDGRFSWEEVECLGACANAPMAQIGKDYYEDLTAESMARILDELAAGQVPRPGPQSGRFASEPAAGLTSLTEMTGGHAANASVTIAEAMGDTIARITGEQTPPGVVPATRANPDAAPAEDRSEAPRSVPRAKSESIAKPQVDKSDLAKPTLLEAPREGRADDLKRIDGLGPKAEEALNALGVWHLDQIADWSDAEAQWVSENLEGFRGRITRGNWVTQARALLGRDK